PCRLKFQAKTRQLLEPCPIARILVTRQIAIAPAFDGFGDLRVKGVHEWKVEKNTGKIRQPGIQRVVPRAEGLDLPIHSKERNLAETIIRSEDLLPDAAMMSHDRRVADLTERIWRLVDGRHIVERVLRA